MISRMLFFELYKIMVNKVTFVGFRGGAIAAPAKYLLVMVLRFVAILYSKLGNKNSDAGHIKCSRGLQFPHPCFRQTHPKLFDRQQSFSAWPSPAGWGQWCPAPQFYVSPRPTTKL